MIEKKIHYCWFGDKELPASAKKCLDSWKRNCPDYEIILWNESNFDISINKYVLEAYKAKKWAFLTDYARLWIVYNYGGIYFDTDVEVLRSFDDLLGFESFFGIEASEKKCVNTGLGFGAEKGNNLVLEIMQQYEDIHFRIDEELYDLTPCPDRNTKVFEKYGYKYKDENFYIGNSIVLASEYMCPKQLETGNLVCTEKTLSIHHFDASWQSFSTRIKSLIYKKIVKYVSFLLKR